jgi:hypothetical protein
LIVIAGYAVKRLVVAVAVAAAAAAAVAAVAVAAVAVAAAVVILAAAAGVVGAVVSELTQAAAAAATLGWKWRESKTVAGVDAYPPLGPWMTMAPIQVQPSSRSQHGGCHHKDLRTQSA